MFKHFRLDGNISAKDWNAAMAQPITALAIRSLINRADFNASDFFMHYAANHIGDPPTVADTIAMLQLAGLNVEAKHVPFGLLREFEPPYLIYLNAVEERQIGEGFIYIQSLGSSRAVHSSNPFEVNHMSVAELEERWSGIVISILDAPSSKARMSDVAAFEEQLHIFDDFVSERECSELIEICEEARFRRSTVARSQNGVSKGVVDTTSRSSCSVTLHENNNWLLSKIYERCSKLEKVPVEHVETIQGVRYKKGQRFKPHFDGGTMPRMTTYLVYLNDDFEGGETVFPACGRTVRPRMGTALRFPSSDLDGKILWQSFHGGMPVSKGRKYALNVWVHSPEVAADKAIQPNP